MRVKIPEEDKKLFFWWYLYLFHPPRPIYEEATQDLDWWESSTKLLAGLLGRLCCCIPSQGVISWNSIKAASCMNGINRLMSIKEKMASQCLLVFTVSLLWINLWCGQAWVICWLCHTGSTWNSSLEFSVMTVSHPEQLMLGMPTCPSSAGLSTRLHKFGYIASRFFPSSLCICSLCYWASLPRH